MQAFFTGGYYNGQLVVVSLWRLDDPALEPFGGGRRLIEALLTTMGVWPEDARPKLEPPCGPLLLR